MLTVSALREKYGEAYITIFEEMVIPWQPLPIGDFISYEDKFRRALIASSVLEDEIFRKCVMDKDLVNKLDFLSAGLVTTVAQNIMEASGPTGIDQFNVKLEACREVAMSPIHHMTSLIARAFPAYTPDAIYKLPYETFMLRLAQAEYLLLQAGVIAEAVVLLSPEQLEEVANKKQRKPIPSELKNLWDKQNTKRSEPVPTSQRPAETKQPKTTKDVVNPSPPIKTGDLPSPILDAKGNVRKTKGLKRDRMATEEGSPDDSELRAKMLSEAQWIYKDVLNKIQTKPPAK